MANTIEDVEQELVDRIKNNRPGKPFRPTVYSEQGKQLSSVEGDIAVNLYVKLTKEDRLEYQKKYYAADNEWVRDRGKGCSFSPYLFMDWKR